MSECADMVKPCYTAFILICGNNFRNLNTGLWMWDLYSAEVCSLVHNTLTPWKMTTICRRCIEICFIKRNLCISIHISLEYLPGCSLDNHHILVQLRRRNTLWSNDSLDYWRICASPGLDRIRGRLYAYSSWLCNWRLNMIVTLGMKNIANSRHAPTLNYKITIKKTPFRLALGRVYLMIFPAIAKQVK